MPTVPAACGSRRRPPQRTGRPRSFPPHGWRRARPPAGGQALLQHRFEVDPLACPTCRGPMRILARITQTAVIDQILTHFQTRAAREAHAGARSPHRRGPPRAGARHAPHARPLTPRLSPEYGLDAPRPRGGDPRARPSHGRVRVDPVGSGHSTVTAALTARTAHEGVAGHAAARHAALARSAIAP